MCTCVRACTCMCMCFSPCVCVPPYLPLPGNVLRAEMGAQWIQSATGNPITALAKKMGLTIGSMNSDDQQYTATGEAYSDSEANDAEDAYSNLEDARKEYTDALKSDMSLDAAYRKVDKETYLTPYVQVGWLIKGGMHAGRMVCKGMHADRKVYEGIWSASHHCVTRTRRSGRARFFPPSVFFSFCYAYVYALSPLPTLPAPNPSPSPALLWIMSLSSEGVWSTSHRCNTRMKSSERVFFLLLYLSFHSLSLTPSPPSPASLLPPVPHCCGLRVCARRANGVRVITVL